MPKRRKSPITWRRFISLKAIIHERTRCSSARSLFVKKFCRRTIRALLRLTTILPPFVPASKLYGDAERLYKKALSIRENSLGADHPHVAETLYNLGLLYLKEKKYEAAEELS